MNSLNYKKSRYTAGGTSEVANNKIEWWERATFSSDVTDAVYIVDKFFESRPDLISLSFYGDVQYWWFICQYNSILDPYSEIIQGRKLFIPSKDRMTNLLKTKLGGVQSTREDISYITPL